jgi:CcmD family protein
MSHGDHLGYLFAAYTLVWIGIFVYVRRLARKSRALEDQIAELRRTLER